MSEENEEAIFVDPALRGKSVIVLTCSYTHEIILLLLYLIVTCTGFLPAQVRVCFDPLDGSSNIDCGVSIGTVCVIIALTIVLRFFFSTCGLYCTGKGAFSFQKNFYSIRHIEFLDTCMKH